MKREVQVMLDNVRSAHNVGSIFRTSDGAGVSKIYLVGYTPAPLDRFGRVQPEIKKTSLGASKTVSWQQLDDQSAIEILVSLKKEGWQIVVVEQVPEAVSLYDFKPAQKIVYILGNEIDGVRPDLISVADKVIEIPMHGHKESLNVSVATGIVLFNSLA